MAPLYPCVARDFLFLPRPVRLLLGYATMTMFAVLFYSVPLLAIFTMLLFVVRVPVALPVLVYGATIASFLLPVREIPWMRRMGQLWYDILQFHCNIDDDARERYIRAGLTQQYIICMHPHGIVPFQAILWAAYCDQYLQNDANALYGFGAAADVVAYVPFLRNIMIWLGAGSAEYKVLKSGLAGKCECVNNNNNRIPRNLYLLPGGIAEVFTSAPKKHVIVFKSRKGLCRLSLETGAQLIPTYVFGGTDFFNNLATGDGLVSKLSRRLRMGLTIFYGHFLLPLPFVPKVSMCLAEPIPVERWRGDGPVPDALVDALHAQYIAALVALFDKYKESAGYRHSVLQVQ